MILTIIVAALVAEYAGGPAFRTRVAEFLGLGDPS